MMHTAQYIEGNTDIKQQVTGRCLVQVHSPTGGDQKHTKTLHQPLAPQLPPAHRNEPYSELSSFWSQHWPKVIEGGRLQNGLWSDFHGPQSHPITQRCPRAEHFSTNTFFTTRIAALQRSLCLTPTPSSVCVCVNLTLANPSARVRCHSSPQYTLTLPERPHHPSTFLT